MDTPQEIVKDIAATFLLSDAEIAKRVDSSQPTIWRIRTEATDCAASLYIALQTLRANLISEAA